MQVEESVNVTEKWVLSMREEGFLSQVSTQTAQTRRWFTKLSRTKSVYILPIELRPQVTRVVIVLLSVCVDSV